MIACATLDVQRKHPLYASRNQCYTKWVALITQQAQLGNCKCPGIMDWPDGRGFGALPEEVACAQEALSYNELSEDERHCALFTDGSCHVVGNYQKCKGAVWSLI